MFICQHCPYVKHVEQEIAKIGKDYQGKKLGIIGISSNDPATYPDDAPDRLKEMAQRLGFRFPYCFDETQDVAKAYKAACTPDFYVFDGQQRLVYRGQLDDSRPSNGKPVTGRDLRAALDAVLAGKPVDPNQKPSIGCSIKWKPGNAP
jgi:thiol-disulfide isomerase/thioredoxin